MALLAVRIGEVEAICTIADSSHRFGGGLEQWQLIAYDAANPLNDLRLDFSHDDFRSLHTCLTRLLEMYETRNMKTRTEG